MRKSKKAFILVTVLLVLLIPVYLYWQNNAIEISYYNFSEKNIPEAFNGYKIVQVSDLHNKDFKDQLTNKVSDEEPDVILVTGDVIDRNRTNIVTAVNALEELVELAPVYFVSGNHEVASGVYDVLREELKRIGVINLDNAIETLTVNEAEIGLIGIEDPLMHQIDEIDRIGSRELLIEQTIEELLMESGADYTILMSHRAELLSVYAQTSVDLTVTGHAHGGQIRLPFINGVYAPSQGFFPEFTGGIYEENGSQMIVSRGLGNSAFPLRINNRPELIVITLESE